MRFCNDKDIFAFFEKAMQKFRRVPYACRTRGSYYIEFGRSLVVNNQQEFNNDSRSVIYKG